jgi:hypothetical protein
VWKRCGYSVLQCDRRNIEEPQASEDSMRLDPIRVIAARVKSSESRSRTTGE